MMEEKVKNEYFELLRFESVGADPAKLGDCVGCASWLRRWLGEVGFECELLYPQSPSASSSEGAAKMLPPPVLFAQRNGSEGMPVVLIYGHYDVQPADPVAEWKTPPFEPTVRDDRVYCRGAQDDKGQFFAFLCGMKDYLSGEGARPTIKIVLEGQEESGSAALSEMAPSLRRKLAADVLLVCDTGAAAEMRPAIIAGLRGVSHFTIRLSGANRDLHSGEYGGIAPNAAQAMAELVSSLHLRDGSIAVAGFRDGIEPPAHDELRAAELSAPTKEALENDIGCEPVGGQLGKTIVQRNSFEPTIEVNGIHSGYGGPGAKTVIPCEAVAKISMRLVPGQNPKSAFDAVRRHLEDNVPRGMKMSLEDYNPGAGGFRLPLSSPLFRLAEEVLAKMDERGPVFVWDGASIPVVSVIREVSGAAPLIVGWGQPEDRIHSPNESYSFLQFDKARDWARRILSAIAG